MRGDRRTAWLIVDPLEGCCEVLLLRGGVLGDHVGGRGGLRRAGGLPVTVDLASTPAARERSGGGDEGGIVAGGRDDLRQLDPLPADREHHRAVGIGGLLLQVGAADLPPLLGALVRPGQVDALDQVLLEGHDGTQVILALDRDRGEADVVVDGDRDRTGGDGHRERRLAGVAGLLGHHHGRLVADGGGARHVADADHEDDHEHAEKTGDHEGVVAPLVVLDLARVGGGLGRDGRLGHGASRGVGRCVSR